MKNTDTSGPAWHDDDAFWETFEFFFSEELWQKAPGEVAAVTQLAGVQPGAAVLDLCCGPGRHALELARRGFIVIGVDRTARYLERARASADKEGLDLELVREDMRDFVRPGAFHLVLNLMTSFAYFDDPEQDRQVATQILESLRPGGALVIDMMGKEVLARIFQERDWQPLPDGGFWLQERRVDRCWSRVTARWILVQQGAVREVTLSHRLYSASELTTLLLDVGFSEAEAFGSLDGDPYDPEAQRLVVLARR